MYVDLDAVSLFGGATDDQVAASSKGFTSKNEKKTKNIWMNWTSISLITRSILE
jgi:hypothetical protein